MLAVASVLVHGDDTEVLREKRSLLVKWGGGGGAGGAAGAGRPAAATRPTSPPQIPVVGIITKPVGYAVPVEVPYVPPPMPYSPPAAAYSPPVAAYSPPPYTG